MDWAKERDRQTYAWLRYLLGLAAGSLSILVSLQSAPAQGTAGILQRASWMLIGCGILLGSVRLSGEVRTARALVEILGKRLQASHVEPTSGGPIVPELPKLISGAEAWCYRCLALGLVALVAGAVLR